MPMLMGPPNRACYKHTCRIQQCLSENNFDFRACAWAIDALKRCCEMPHAKYSIHCAFPDLNRQQQEGVEQENEIKDEQKEKKSAENEEKQQQPNSDESSSGETNNNERKFEKGRIEGIIESDPPG